jgi:hypothetical protein
MIKFLIFAIFNLVSQRSTLTTDIYYDPWARHTKDKNEGTIADQQKTRKRRWNSSSSSSKDRNERVII